MSILYIGTNVPERLVLITVQLLCVILYIVSPAVSDSCVFLNPCKCQFSNGSVIDLSSVGSRNGARFKHQKPSSKSDEYFYYYNPCYSFDFGGCKNVAVCQVNGSEESFQNCGSQDRSFFAYENGHVVLSYTSPRDTDKRQTNVVLQCSSNSEEDELSVTGEGPKRVYNMTLISKCACPDGCIESGLSFGSGLVIIFFICVLLYLCLGIVYMHLVRGAHGCELIPNYEFWKDFPLLVKDGCIYVSSGCRRETSYERI